LKLLSNALRIGLIGQAMYRFQRLHHVMQKGQGIFGKLYNFCIRAIRPTLDAADMEIRLSNNSAYSQLQLLWDLWALFDKIVLPRIYCQFLGWRFPFKSKHLESSSENFEEEVTGTSEVNCSFSTESLILSTKENLDLPFSYANPSMAELVTCYYDRSQTVSEEKINTVDNYRKCTEFLLNWEDKEEESTTEEFYNDYDTKTHDKESFKSFVDSNISENLKLSGFSSSLELILKKTGDKIDLNLEHKPKNVHTDKNTFGNVLQNDSRTEKNSENMKGHKNDTEKKISEIDNKYKELESYIELEETSTSSLNIEADFRSTVPISFQENEKSHSIIESCLLDSISNTQLEAVENSASTLSSTKRICSSRYSVETYKEISNDFFSEGLKKIDRILKSADEVDSKDKDILKSCLRQIKEELEHETEEFLDLVSDEKNENLFELGSVEKVLFCTGIAEESDSKQKTAYFKIDPDETLTIAEQEESTTAQNNSTCTESVVDNDQVTDAIRLNSPQNLQEDYQIHHPSSCHKTGSDSKNSKEEEVHENKNFNMTIIDVTDFNKQSIEVHQNSNFEKSLFNSTIFEKKIDDDAYQVKNKAETEQIACTTLIEYDESEYTTLPSFDYNFSQSTHKSNCPSEMTKDKIDNRCVKNCAHETENDEVEIHAVITDGMEDKDEQQFVSNISIEHVKHDYSTSQCQEINSELETLFEEECTTIEYQNTIGLGNIHQVVEKNVWEKVIHVPIPDMSPPIKKSASSPSYHRQLKSASLNSNLEDVSSDGGFENSISNNDTASRSEIFHSNDFSPSVRSDNQSLQGFFRRKWSQIKKSRSKFDLSQASSADLTVKSKWKRSNPGLSDSSNHTTPNSSFNESLTRSPNRSWAGSVSSLLGKKKKRAKLTIGHHSVDFDEPMATNPLLSKWQKSASISNLPESSFSPHFLQTSTKMSTFIAKSLDDISDYSEVRKLGETKER